MTEVEISAVRSKLDVPPSTGVFISIDGDVIDGSLDAAIELIIEAAKRAGVVRAAQEAQR